MARSAPADYREFIRVCVDLPANPKLAMIDNPAAGWAYVVSLCYCGQHLTDGSFPMPALLRLAGVKPAVAKALIGAGLWHEAGHTCERCPQPMAGTGIVHDYLVHQRSSGEAKALRDVRREAGKRGAASRWHGNGDGKSHSKSHANAMADASQTDGRAMPEVEVEEELKEPPPTVPPAAKPASRKRPATRLPDDWQPTDAHRDLAARLSVDLAFQADQFRNHAEANDRRQASWDAAFRQWLNNAPRFTRRSPPQSSLFGQTEGWQALKQTGTEPRLRSITGGDPC